MLHLTFTQVEGNTTVMSIIHQYSLISITEIGFYQCVCFTNNSVKFKLQQ